MISIYMMASKFGRPPSHWFPELNALERYLLDIHVFRLGTEEEERVAARMARRARSRFRR